MAVLGFPVLLVAIMFLCVWKTHKGRVVVRYGGGYALLWNPYKRLRVWKRTHKGRMTNTTRESHLSDSKKPEVDRDNKDSGQSDVMGVDASCCFRDDCELILSASCSVGASGNALVDESGIFSPAALR